MKVVRTFSMLRDNRETY